MIFLGAFMFKKSFLFSIILIFTTSFIEAKEYSPGVDKDYPKKLLWGDTHLHSNESADGLYNW